MKFCAKCAAQVKYACASLCEDCKDDIDVKNFRSSPYTGFAAPPLRMCTGSKHVSAGPAKGRVERQQSDY